MSDNYFPEDLVLAIEAHIKPIAKIFMFIALITFLLYSCSNCNGWLGQEDDWIGEEVLEKVIEYQFGIEIDLTPDSPE